MNDIELKAPKLAVTSKLTPILLLVAVFLNLFFVKNEILNILFSQILSYSTLWIIYTFLRWKWYMKGRIDELARVIDDIKNQKNANQ